MEQLLTKAATPATRLAAEQPTTTLITTTPPISAVPAHPGQAGRQDVSTRPGPSGPPRSRQRPGDTSRPPAGRRPAAVDRLTADRRPKAAQHQATSDQHRPQVLIYQADIPGSLCLNELQRRGVLIMLDSTAGYLAMTASSLPGRALIAEQLMPKGTVAASTLALWVWQGGTLPSDIRVLTRTHFRAPVFGRRICPQERAVEADDRHRVGPITITSPLRTACDVACLPLEHFSREVGLARLSDFLQFYELSLPSCRALLVANPRWPGQTVGLAVLEQLESALAWS